jgi:hypothetical protein
MSRKYDSKRLTDSAKLLSAKKHHESEHLKHIGPDMSQGGLTGVRFVAHEAQSAGHLFQPYPFNKGMGRRIYGDKEHQIMDTLGSPHPTMYRSENLQKMVKSTVGNAYNLANPDKGPVGRKHRSNTVRGSLLGPFATQPERYGQVPYAGRFF